MRSTRAALIVLTIFVSAARVSAQSVTDPRLAEFDPSADHDALSADGTPLVQSYSLSIYEAGSAQVLQTVSLGKPAPDADGKIRVEFLSLLNPAPVPGVVYEARVSAVGPGGSTASDVSNTFSFSLTCSASITPTSQTFPSSASGSGTVAVRIATGCPWTSVSNAAWLTITGGASGTESGTVTFNVAENTATIERSGTLTIASQLFTITQAAAASCTYAISPASQSVSSAGGSGSFSLTTAGACAWTATSSASWIAVTGTASGSGSGTVTFSVAANTSTSQRTGSITVGGQTFTITQDAAPSCAYAISPASQSVPSAGGTGSFTVTTTGGCAWSASSTVNWIIVTAGASGSGSGTVTFSVAANSATSSRTGTITAGGQTFTVDQAAAAPCTYAVSPASQSMPAAGGTGSVTMTTGAGCAWSSYSNASWITITSGASGTGNGTITFSVAPNTATTQRTGTVMIAGQTVSVTQAAATTSCSYALSPTSQSVPASGGTGSISMTAGTGCAWTAASNASWITVTGGASGSGSGTVTFTVAANTTTTPRTGTITAGGQTFTVNQDAASSSCTYSISPTSQSFGSLGGSNWVTVTATAGCGWTAVSNASWVTVVAGASGTGNGTVSYSVASNTGAARSATITIAGQTFTISQAAAACSYSVTPTSVSMPASGGTGAITVTVTAGSGCSWGSFSSTSWVTVSGSGTGSGMAGYAVAANTTGTSRSGTILVAGKTIAFTQAGQ